MFSKNIPADKNGTTPPYEGCCIILTTKHAKSLAMNKVFDETLKAGVLEYVFDTDTLGTFSGETKRKGSALAIARKKCVIGLKKAKAEFAIGSEGSFGAHHIFPFLPANREILYFIDKKRKFEFYVTDSTTDTNFSHKDVSSIDDLWSFAEAAFFPSHALIIRPKSEKKNIPIFKGITNMSDLEAAYLDAMKISEYNEVRVETDMRAHLNPTRMKFIEHLAQKLANRLSYHCPKCKTPGWGVVDIEAGLPCEICGSPTDEIKAEICGCTKCNFKAPRVPDGCLGYAGPSNCFFCNP